MPMSSKRFSLLMEAYEKAPSRQDAQSLFDALTTLKLCTEIHPPFLPFFARHANDFVELFEDHLSTRSYEQFISKDYVDTAPLFNLITSYAAICQALERPPAPSTHPWFETLYHHYTLEWSTSGSMHIHFAHINTYLSVLPEDISAPMILSAPIFPWVLAPSNSSEVIFEAIIQHLQQPLPSSFKYGIQRDGYIEQAEWCIRILGEPFIPYAARALTENKQPHRKILITFLARFPKNQDAIKALVSVLRDSSKAMREAAHDKLLDLDHDSVLDAIPTVLDARAKSARLAAAHLLRALPSSTRAQKLARQRLEREKLADIKEVLLDVHADDLPDELDDARVDRFEQAVTSLRETSGESWREFTDLGDALLSAYDHMWRASAQSMKHHTDFYLDEDRYTFARGWRELLESRASDDALALELALGLMSIMGKSWIEDYVELLDGLYGREEVGTKLAELLVEGKIEYVSQYKTWGYDPPEMARTLIEERYPEHFAKLLPSLLQDRKKASHTRALDYLTLHPEALSPEDVIALLSSKRKDLRQVAADALAIVATPEHVASLEALLDKERTREVIQSARAAIAKIAARHFDATAFDTSAQGDEQLDEALGELPQQALFHGFAEHLDALTRPRWIHAQTPMSEGAFTWMLAEIQQESMTRHSRLLQEVCARLDTHEVHQLCEALIEKVAQGHIAGWSLFMQATLASPERLDKTGARLDDFAQSSHYGWGDHGVCVMERVNSPMTVRILDDWTRKSRRDALKWRAKAALERMALARGIDLDALIEMSVPDFGFDARGERRFDYGGRTMCVKLGMGDELAYIDESRGVVLESLPAASNKDDADLVQHAKSEVALIKKELRRLRRAQQTRFIEAMISEKRWELDVWKARYVFNPVMRSFAQGVLWGIFDALTHTLRAAVIVDVSGDLIDIEDEVRALDESTERLGVVHPVMLDETTREKWTQTFADYEIIEAFPQLTREVHLKKDWPETSRSLCDRFQGVRFATFMGRTERLGWQRGIREDAGMIQSTSRTMGSFFLTLHHSGYTPEYIEEHDVLELQHITIQDRAAEHVDLDALPAHVFSELIHDLVHIMS